jgi:hypothetical protein
VSVARTERPGLTRYLVMGAGIVGIVGFTAGFFLPIILSPDANQGPLLGLFITGPGGALLGLGVGLIGGLLRLDDTRFLLTVVVVAAALAAGTLVFSFPEPVSVGTIVEAEVVRCERADQHLPAAVAEWRRQIDAGWVRALRSGWEADVPAVLARDPGVVLVLRVKRQVVLVEHRKPWNHGRLTQRVQPGDGRESVFYRRGVPADCAGPLPQEVRFTPRWSYTQPLPPDNAAGLLRLSAIGDVPPELERAAASAE